MTMTSSTAPSTWPQKTKSMLGHSGSIGGGLPMPAGLVFSGDTGPCFSAVTSAATAAAAATAQAAKTLIRVAVFMTLLAV